MILKAASSSEFAFKSLSKILSISTLPVWEFTEKEIIKNTVLSFLIVFYQNKGSMKRTEKEGSRTHGSRKRKKLERRKRKSDH